MILDSKAAYRHKIRTPEEIAEIVGDFGARDTSVCMCHGTFDGVHPGHVLHMSYAKEHAGILIASLTADAQITKGNAKPHYPEELRALNLAAYQMVDFVVIDREATPLKNIATIKPDFFAKGYEYKGQNPKTAEETAAVEAYGGQMMFTPGDIVYSSSAILAQHAPNVANEALAATMDAHGLTFADIRDALDKIAGLRVHVVGDTIVDTITETATIGASGKTPTLSVQVHGKRDYVGGAAIVAKHLKAAGAEVTYSTVLGRDAPGLFVTREMAEAGIRFRPFIDATRPTTDKNAVVAGGYRLLKLDTVDNRPLSEHAIDSLLESLRVVAADVVVFSDFRHGIFTRDTIPRLTDAIPMVAFRAADSQVASRWGNILDFHGFDLVTPNEKEARFALGDQDSVVRPLISSLYDKSGCRTVIMKMGDRGVLTQQAPLGDDHYLHTVGSFARSVVDAVGAGDALLAYASLSIKATGSALIGSILGSIAAALECEVDGNTPISVAEVGARLNRIERDLTG